MSIFALRIKACCSRCQMIAYTTKFASDQNVSLQKVRKFDTMK